MVVACSRLSAVGAIEKAGKRKTGCLSFPFLVRASFSFVRPLFSSYSLTESLEQATVVLKHSHSKAVLQSVIQARPVGRGGAMGAPAPPPPPADC